MTNVAFYLTFLSKCHHQSTTRPSLFLDVFSSRFWMCQNCPYTFWGDHVAVVGSCAESLGVKGRVTCTGVGGAVRCMMIMTSLLCCLKFSEFFLEDR